MSNDVTYFKIGQARARGRFEIASMITPLIIKMAISSLVINIKKVLFSTNSLAKLLSDSLLLDSLSSDSSISQVVITCVCARGCFCVFAGNLKMFTPLLSVL